MTETIDFAANLASVKADIADAARQAGRAPESITLVAVGKGHPAERSRAVLAAGQRVFGENRVQEAEEKWPALKADFPDARVHLIGPLQTNKVRHAVALFDVIETRRSAAAGAGTGAGIRQFGTAASLLYPGEYRRGTAKGRCPARRGRCILSRNVVTSWACLSPD